VPDIDTQKEIVKVYQVITDRIALKRQINEKLEEMAGIYFKSIFAVFATFSQSEFIQKSKDMIPSNWKLAKISDYCDENIENVSAGRYPFVYLDTGNITCNYINNLQNYSKYSELPSRAKRKVFNNDIVYSTVRPNLQHHGIIYDPPGNMIASTGFTVLHNKGEKVSNELIYLWLTNKITEKYLQALAENSVSTYPALNSSDLLDVNIIIPDKEILNTINKYLKTIFREIYINNNEIRNLFVIKELLLSVMFSKFTKESI
jgi:type I restriction enzyme S subunit